MPKTSVFARVVDGDQLECQVVSLRGNTMTLTGATGDVEPRAEGADSLRRNRSLVNNAWAFAKFTYLKVSLQSEEEQKDAERRAKAHREIAEWIAGLADNLGTSTKWGWCSACFAYVDHQKVKLLPGQLPAYLCGNCGSSTSPCADPTCKNMAVRAQGAIRAPQYCAEHRHKIPGFAKADQKMGSLGDYRAFLKYEKPNLSRATKLVGLGITGIALGAPAALVVAPAIGGAIGTLIGGYYGAAATSWGLALLGGGTLAAGGLGMAGGTLVVTALGGALGGVLGASVMNAYVREDKSFHIEMLQGGDGVPVVVCSGFLSESGKGWDEWQRLVTERYPDSTVYRVHWGAKELRDLGILGVLGAVKVAGPAALKQAALAATKIGARKLGPLAPVLLGADLASNPWHVARNRADKTGVIVADLLARTNAESYVLVGHSLGARVMAVAAQTLGTKPDGPRIQTAHLLGAAVTADLHGDMLCAAVDEAVYNYYSTKDKVLKYLYSAGQGGRAAAGLRGFTSKAPKLLNIDVSAQVGRHSDYFDIVSLE